MTNSPSRRQFVAQSFACVAAGSLTCALAKASPAFGPKSLRVGIIGATKRGDYGHGLDLAVAKAPGCEIVALADADDAGREAARKRTGAAAVYGDYREMLAKEKIELVVISPRWIDQRREMLLAAAEAGCHVYMEKPFCRTLADCDDVIAAFDRNRLRIAIAHIAQYSPVLNVVLSLIQQGEIGELLEIRVRGKEDQRGGAEDLWVLGSHVLGMMRSVSGGDARRCAATVTQAGRPIARADVKDGAEGIGPLAGDEVQARYDFVSGTTGYFASRRGAGGSPSRFGVVIYGSKGMIEMESGYLSKAWLLRDPSWSSARSGKRWEPITSAGIGKEETRQDGNYEGGHLAAIADLLASIEQDRAPICSAQDGRAIVEMIAAAFESQRLGTSVELPLKTRVNPLTLLE